MDTQLDDDVKIAFIESIQSASSDGTIHGSYNLAFVFDLDSRFGQPGSETRERLRASLRNWKRHNGPNLQYLRLSRIIQSRNRNRNQAAGRGDNDDEEALIVVRPPPPGPGAGALVAPQMMNYPPMVNYPPMTNYHPMAVMMSLQSMAHLTMTQQQAEREERRLHEEAEERRRTAEREERLLREEAEERRRTAEREERLLREEAEERRRTAEREERLLREEAEERRRTAEREERLLREEAERAAQQEREQRSAHHHVVVLDALVGTEDRLRTEIRSTVRPSRRNRAGNIESPDNLDAVDLFGQGTFDCWDCPPGILWNAKTQGETEKVDRSETDDGLIMLLDSKSVKQLTYLWTLDLESSSIDDLDLMARSLNLSDLPSLPTMSFMSSPIANAAAAAAANNFASTAAPPVRPRGRKNLSKVASAAPAKAKEHENSRSNDSENVSSGDNQNVLSEENENSPPKGNESVASGDNESVSSGDNQKAPSEENESTSGERVAVDEISSEESDESSAYSEDSDNNETNARRSRSRRGNRNFVNGDTVRVGNVSGKNAHFAGKKGQIKGKEHGNWLVEFRDGSEGRFKTKSLE